MVDTKTDSGDESWQIALKTAKKLGYVPIAFSQAIRMLVADHFTNNGQLRSVTKYQVSRLFRGASFKATIYFATKQLKSDYLLKNTSCSIGDLVALYSPLDLAAFVTCFFLNRHLKKTESPVWGAVMPHFMREASIGALVGVAIPQIGFGPGLILGGLRNVAHALMSMEKPEQYRTFREKLTASGKVTDEALEKATWNTTSSQVASMILTILGFKAEVGDIIPLATGTRQRVTEITNERLRTFRLAYIWHEVFLLNLEQPLEKLEVKYFPTDANRELARSFILNAMEDHVSWLARGKDDLNAQKTPHLFAKKQGNPDLEIPDELKDVFNLEELTSMDENDFDALIDQIDAEQKAASKRDDVISKKDLEELEKQCE